MILIFVLLQRHWFLFVCLVLHVFISLLLAERLTFFGWLLVEPRDYLPFVKRFPLQSFLDYLGSKWLSKSGDGVLQNLIVSQNANLTELLDHFKTLIILIVEDELNLFKQNLLIFTSKTVIKHLPVPFNSRLQMLQRLLRPCNNALCKHSTRMHIRILNQLLRRILAVEGVNDDQGTGLVQLPLCVCLVAWQVLVELAVKLVLRFLDEYESANDHEHFLEGLLLESAHGTRRELQKERLSTGQFFTGGLADIGTQEVNDPSYLTWRVLIQFGEYLGTEFGLELLLQFAQFVLRVQHRGHQDSQVDWRQL